MRRLVISVYEGTHFPFLAALSQSTGIHFWPGEEINEHVSNSGWRTYEQLPWNWLLSSSLISELCFLNVILWKKSKSKQFEIHSGLRFSPWLHWPDKHHLVRNTEQPGRRVTSGTRRRNETGMFCVDKRVHILEEQRAPTHSLSDLHGSRQLVSA